MTVMFAVGRRGPAMQSQPRRPTCRSPRAERHGTAGDLPMASDQLFWQSSRVAVPSLNLFLLLSAPSDVPLEHLTIIQRTLVQWNVMYGRASGTAVLPLSWSDHATSEYGERPQGLINKQLVDDADLLLAVFTDRLGTPTGEAPSGTVEEIERVWAAGKHVSILRNLCPRGPLTVTTAAEEKARLERYLEGLRDKALVLGYTSEAELVQHVHSMLSRVTAKVQQGVEDSRAALADGTGEDEGAGVWPRIEVNETVRSDSRGRLRPDRRWYLVLENTTGRPVHNVTFRLEGIPEGALFQAHGQETPVETMPPGGSARYPLLIAMGSPDQARCVVSWTDSRGEHKTVATVRT